jgi:cysteine desulfurase
MNKRIYLDFNATTTIDAQVANFMSELICSGVAYNPSSIHKDGRDARAIVEKARTQIADSLSIDIKKDELQIIFTSSGTEANNLLINNFYDITFLAGATEHISILGVSHPNMIIIPVDYNGLIDKEQFEQILQQHKGTKLVSIMLANNETGVIADIENLSKIAKENGAMFHCDASQAFGKFLFNFKDLCCDAITISSHKAGGPLGAAALIVKQDLIRRPMISGGKQEYSLRAGTENTIAIAGFGMAATRINNRIIKSDLRDYLESEIKLITHEAKFFGSDVQRLSNTSSIRMPNVKNETQLIKFDLNNISVSAGSACSSGRIAISHVLKAMNIDEQEAGQTIRVSLGPQTTKEQIDQFIYYWKTIYLKEQ